MHELQHKVFGVFFRRLENGLQDPVETKWIAVILKPSIRPWHSADSCLNVSTLYRYNYLQFVIEFNCSWLESSKKQVFRFSHWLPHYFDKTTFAPRICALRRAIGDTLSVDFCPFCFVNDHPPSFDCTNAKLVQFFEESINFCFQFLFSNSIRKFVRVQLVMFIEVKESF